MPDYLIRGTSGQYIVLDVKFQRSATGYMQIMESKCEATLNIIVNIASMLYYKRLEEHLSIHFTFSLLKINQLESAHTCNQVFGGRKYHSFKVLYVYK